MKGILIYSLIIILELTSGEVDTLKGLRSDEISVMGLRVGMGERDVERCLGTPLFKNETQGMWLYKDIIVYFNKKGVVKRISLKRSFADVVKGKIKGVFSDEIFKDKKLREKLLGEEVELKVENIEMSKVKVEKWRFDFGNGIVIEGSKKGEEYTFQFLNLVLAGEEE